MSRSYRHSPAGGVTTSDSEKKDKRIWNRRVRHAVRQILRTHADLDVTPDLPSVREITNIWDGNKDGKIWYSWLPRWHTREEHEEIMRKVMRK